MISSFLHLCFFLLRQKDHFGEMENGKLVLSAFAGLPVASLPAARKELLHEKHSGQQRWLQPVLLVTGCSLWFRHNVYPS